MPPLADKGGKATDASKRLESSAPNPEVEDHVDMNRKGDGNEVTLESLGLKKFVTDAMAALDRGIELQAFVHHGDEIREFYNACASEQDPNHQALLQVLQDQLATWQQGFKAYKAQVELSSTHRPAQVRTANAESNADAEDRTADGARTANVEARTARVEDRTAKVEDRTAGVNVRAADAEADAESEADLIDIQGLKAVHENDKTHLHMVSSPNNSLGRLLFVEKMHRKSGDGCKYSRLGSLDQVPRPKCQDIVIQFSPANLKLLVQAYYHFQERKAELLLQWELASSAKFNFAEMPELQCHETEPRKSDRFHALRKTNVPNKLAVEKPVFGHRRRLKEISVVEKRFLLLRGLPNQPADGYIDVGSGALVKKANKSRDDVVEESEDTYKVLWMLIRELKEEDLDEEAYAKRQVATASVAIKRERDETAGDSSPHKKAKVC